MHRIVHLTSAHPRSDTRIFIKMCRSLVVAGYDVSLVVADGLGDEQIDAVKVIDAGRTKSGRMSRWTGTVRRVRALALALDADLFHLHDPELLPLAYELKRRGSKVIFDAHEDFPQQVLSKTYLNPILRRLISFVFKHFERFVWARLDAVVGATPFITSKFSRLGVAYANVNNFPILGELSVGAEYRPMKEISFVGAIHRIRGIQELVDALSYLPGVTLNLVGLFNDDELAESVQRSAGWTSVNEAGFMTRDQVSEILARSMAGIVTFHPMPNHVNAQPNKMFEYMSAGIPVVASDFPMWREIVEGNDCGICVDPLDPVSIADGVRWLCDNPEYAKKMGENGKRAVVEKYNWAAEESKLIELYRKIL